jgi:hypothetical protein
MNPLPSQYSSPPPPPPTKIEDLLMSCRSEKYINKLDVTKGNGIFDCCNMLHCENSVSVFFIKYTIIHLQQIYNCLYALGSGSTAAVLQYL